MAALQSTESEGAAARSVATGQAPASAHSPATALRTKTFASNPFTRQVD